MAQRLVDVYGRLGVKSHKLLLLPPSTLYLLAAPLTPDEAIQRVEEQLDERKPLGAAVVQKTIKETGCRRCLRRKSRFRTMALLSLHRLVSERD